MLKWIKEIMDGIRWARSNMLANRERDAFTKRVSWFLTGTIWPASLKYKKEHGHSPKYLLLPMERLTDVHRIMELRQPPTLSDNKVCGLEVQWNGEEGNEGWSLSDEFSHVEE